MREVAGNICKDASGWVLAVELEGRLGITMKFLRAIEQGMLGEVAVCLQRYPHLATLVDNPYEIGGNLAMRLGLVREHAVGLARDHALDTLGKAKEAAKDGDQARATRAKQKYSRLLFRLAPGRCSSVKAVRDGDGTYLTESSSIANALRTHWREVFRARGIDEARLQVWLAEDAAERGRRAPSHHNLRGVQLTRRHIRTALSTSNNSAPGPDGLPYAAWRRIGDIAVDTLYEAFRDLCGEDAEGSLTDDYPGFNESLLIFLPKKAVGQTEDGDDVFEPGGVRPLNITKTDNRLLASAVRLVLEPVLGPLITEDQRGFIPGRSMISNLLDVDEAMVIEAARGEGSVAFFFDFAAAFPSIEHTLLHEYFGSLGWPPWILRFIRCLYWRNFCQLSLGGTRQTGFEISRGIRQGCPLSPLLFTAASDLVFRRLARHFPNAILRSWADDLAMVLPDGFRMLARLQDIFVDFERVSGLGLNIPKTVLVPLDPYDELEVRRIVARQAPGWGWLGIAKAAKYLGVYVGPGREQLSWQAPMAKYLERARLWSTMGLGVMLTMQAYQVYIASVLLFVGQLEELPADFGLHERRACMHLFPGPKDWITAGCLKELRTLGFPRELKDVQSSVQASKARVVRFEDGGRLRIRERARTLAALACDGLDHSLAREVWWNRWRDRCFVLQLFRGEQKCKPVCLPIQIQDYGWRTTWDGRSE